MKAVLLLAGRGTRLRPVTGGMHKSLLELQGTPALGHLVQRLVASGVDDLVLILGHAAATVDEFVRTEFADLSRIRTVINPRYAETNNLYSLCCAQDELEGSEFIVCNGDLVIHQEILRGMIERESSAAIAVDDSPRNTPIDSPGILVSDGRIRDLGRHIEFEASYGYAIGVYRFDRTLSSHFFDVAARILEDAPHAGYHDPLVELFDEIPIYPHSTRGLSWTDFDIPEDVHRAECLLLEIRQQEASG